MSDTALNVALTAWRDARKAQHFKFRLRREALDKQNSAH